MECLSFRPRNSFASYSQGSKLFILLLKFCAIVRLSSVRYLNEFERVLDYLMSPELGFLSVP